MNLVQNIKTICRKKQITIQELEKAANLPKNSIYKWDDHSPSIYKVWAVADVLKVPLDDLAREQEGRKRQ